MIRDQYGKVIPELVRLDPFVMNSYMSAYGVPDSPIFDFVYRAINRVDWYEYQGDIYISWEIAHALDLDRGYFICSDNDTEEEVMWIPSILKRWNLEDGFYHA